MGNINTMADKHLSKADLKGKIIDAHSHVGVSIKMYSRTEYPYAQTIEGLYYQQISGSVDVNIVFPLCADLYFEPEKLLQGQLTPAAKPLSDIPYKTENRLLMREVFDYCPELSDRFIPFVSVDPARDVQGQIKELENIEKKYPIYGIKVVPVGCQSRALELLNKGQSFLDFAAERDIPFLFHATTIPNDEYSQASDIFKIIDRRRELRFCLAHCLIFNKHFLDLANDTANVWVDTAAMKIQVDLANEMVEQNLIKSSDLIDADFSDYRKVMNTICQMYPDTIIWGTDSPAYVYHCMRQQGAGLSHEFALKGTYGNELEALNSLPAEQRIKVSNSNTLDFLFG